MITLNHSSAHAVINPDGAWLGELGVGSDQILFPRSDLKNKEGELKARGGMHVCLPNFGPGGESGLAQHGFGRTSSWTVVSQEASKAVLSLEPTVPGYVGLFATLTYRLESTSLLAELALTNRGSESMRVAPGFHPYFAVEPSEKKVFVNGTRYELSEIEGTEYIRADTAELLTKDQRVILKPENLTTWAIWTDQLGSYVCVEPTFGGNRFLEPESPDEQLAPGETKTYSLRIEW